jgi:uncharacterized alkaline shock family protein YloU
VSAVSDAELADVIAGAVLGVPGVAALHAGMFGEVATYLPGRRVAGVRIRNETVDVHVTVHEGVDVRRTAAAVRDAVVRVTPGPTVDVTVEDIAPAVRP